MRRFVEHMAMTWAGWGFPRMAARVLMTMMSADEDSLTAAELAERLDVSPAAISGAVRYLMQIGIVTREPVRGSRRDRYRLPDDAWYGASVTKKEIYKTIADLADDGVSAAGGTGTRAGARIAEMRDFLLFMNDEMDALLAKWESIRDKGSVGRMPA